MSITKEKGIDHQLLLVIKRKEDINRDIATFVRRSDIALFGDAAKCPNENRFS